MRLKHIKNAEEIISKSKYLVKSPKENKGKWNKVFSNDNNIEIEIGTGKGKFIIGKAFETCNQFSPKKAKKSRNIYSISPKYRVYCYCLKEQGQGFYVTAF